MNLHDPNDADAGGVAHDRSRNGSRHRSPVADDVIPPENLEVLRALRAAGKHLALVSNADVTEAARWDESPASEYFHEAVFSCDVGCAKPDPEIYELCLERLGVRAEEGAFVGDGGSEELRDAGEAGMTTVLVTGVTRDLWRTDLIGAPRAMVVP